MAVEHGCRLQLVTQREFRSAKRGGRRRSPACLTRGQWRCDSPIGNGASDRQCEEQPANRRIVPRSCAIARSKTGCAVTVAGRCHMQPDAALRRRPYGGMKPRSSWGCVCGAHADPQGRVRQQGSRVKGEWRGGCNGQLCTLHTTTCASRVEALGPWRLGTSRQLQANIHCWPPAAFARVEAGR